MTYLEYLENLSYSEAVKAVKGAPVEQLAEEVARLGLSGRDKTVRNRTSYETILLSYAGFTGEPS